MGGKNLRFCGRQVTPDELKLIQETVHDCKALSRPVLMETFVDTSRYRGTCYRAADWIYLGKTTGRGRMDREKKPDESKIKDIFVYPLCRKARERLLEPPPDKSLRVQTHDLHYDQ